MQIQLILPWPSFEGRGAKGSLSIFSISEDAFLDLLFTRKNAIIPPTTKRDITMPAMPPAPIPELLPPSLPPSEVSLLPPLWLRLFLLAGFVPGGGGGAGPEFQELPFDLSWYCFVKFFEFPQEAKNKKEKNKKGSNKYWYHKMLTLSQCRSAVQEPNQ